MGTSKPNQIRYNAKISALFVEIKREKEDFLDKIKSDIEKLLERRSPKDEGNLKRSWRVTLSNKDKLVGHSLKALNTKRAVSVGISVESTSRHAPMQMFGWKAVPGQLLTGNLIGGKWRIYRASKPVFNPPADSPKRRRKRKRNGIRSFITRGGLHGPDKNLAFTGGPHSIKAEISRIISRRLKECKYIGSITFLTPDSAEFWTANKAESRIRQWMDRTLEFELDSRAIRGISGGYSPNYTPH